MSDLYCRPSCVNLDSDDIHSNGSLYRRAGIRVQNVVVVVFVVVIISRSMNRAKRFRAKMHKGTFPRAAIRAETFRVGSCSAR